EKETYIGEITEQEKLTLEYLSKTILSGVRPYELEILKQFFNQEEISVDKLQRDFKSEYGFNIDLKSIKNAVSVLQGHFVSKEEEYQKYCHIDILRYNRGSALQRMQSYADQLQHREFYKQLKDIVSVGLHRYKDKYSTGKVEESPFVLYEKYSRRDVSLLMNCEKDLSSIMYGMKRIEDDVFIFVTYHKVESEDKEKLYPEGKPDYADKFENNKLFRWDSQIGKGLDSSYMKDVLTAKNKHLMVTKNDIKSKKSSYYYMGEFDVVDTKEAQKTNNKGKQQVITKVTMKMHHAVREDLLRYFESGLEKEGETIR
ncbi:DUF3427 domain-containing protein, partial [Muricomes intestini]|uniref:DUF3427 domain-containing protein n=1 Tax=Muricomes intestini TaxID=1796634 RepID=UPI002FDF60FF